MDKLTVSKVAERLNITEYTVRKYIKLGKLKATKEVFKGTAKRYYILEADLKAFQESIK